MSLVAWEVIPDIEADAALEQWGHWLGGCARPFGRNSFGLRFGKKLVAVAVSASTAGTRCGGYSRYEVVELARLCADPEFRSYTRVALRLWRETAPRVWADHYWPVKACVSYSNALRHTGDIYRFDGWRKIGNVRGGYATGGYQAGTAFDPKTVWVYPLPETETGSQTALALSSAGGDE